MGVQMPRFKNPADFILNMTVMPRQIRKGLCLYEMVDKYNTTQRDPIEKELNTIVKQYDGMHAAFTQINENRSSSSWTQFVQIFKRNNIYLIRNPQTIQATFTNAVLFGSLLLCVFWQVANPDR
jgi:hypothetical protein